jgi:hypothetical protein
MSKYKISKNDVANILVKVPELIFLDVSPRFIFAVTQPLTVTHPHSKEKPCLGHLSIKIDLSPSIIPVPFKSTRFDIRGLNIGVGQESFPSIPHLEYINGTDLFVGETITFLKMLLYRNLMSLQQT